MAHEVFLRIHRSIHRFRRDSKVKTWIFALAMNVLRDSWRQKREKNAIALPGQNRRVDGSGNEPQIPVQDSSLSAEEKLTMKERFRDVCEAIEDLQPSQRTALLMKDFYGYTAEEIASVLKLEERTIYNMLTKARNKVRGMLRKEQRA